MDEILTTAKTMVVNLVKQGHQVDSVIPLFHWTEALLAKFGVNLTTEFVATALEGIYEKHSDGLTTHAKKYANFDGDSPWSMGAMVGSVEDTSGSKVISFGRDNTILGLPVSHADGFLADKDTGVRRMTLECITSSDLRTGWFALAFFKVAFQNKTDVEVVVIGAGPIASACIRMLNHGAASSIKRIKVLSKSGTTNHEMVQRLQTDIQIPLEATDDRDCIPLAQYLITATNAGRPVVKNREIADNAAVLSQGIDDLPRAYIKRLISKSATILGDDLLAMEQRNVDPLSLYYSRKGQKLTVEGQEDGVVGIGEVMMNSAYMDFLSNFDRDIAFFPVGIIAYDLAVNIAVEQALIAAIYDAAKNDMNLE